MIDPPFLEGLARKNQTTRDNVLREYCQHLFLSHFYKQEGTEKILFKGGTAFRIIWNSPRFSEDLDFSGIQTSQTEIEDRVQEALLEVEREGLRVRIEESKKTSGGYLGRIFFRYFDSAVPILLEVSQRKGRRDPFSEQALIQNEFIPSYTLLHLSQEEMIREKVQALMDRARPRDFFDLYFIFRSRMPYQSIFGKEKGWKQKVLARLAQTDQNLGKELKRFLPASHAPLLKDFRTVIEREISRNLP